MNATITISLEDFEAQKKKREALEKELAEAKAELEMARLGDGADDRARLAAALGEALVIVQFAIAHLHPLTVRGWPYEALQRLGSRLDRDCPGVPETFRECAKADWGLFAAEAERWERARAEGREQELLAEENDARRIGENHPLMRLQTP